MILLYFIRSWWEYFLGSRRSSVVAWRSALSPFSFRVPRGQGGSPVQVMNWVRFAVVLSQRKVVFEPSLEMLVLDENLKMRNSRLDHVSRIIREKGEFISYYDIRPFDKGMDISLLFNSLFFVLCLLPYLVLSRNRALHALLVYDLVMLHLLDDAVCGSPVKRIIWFGAYEKGTPLLIDWFRRYRGIEVIIVPSTNPLRNFYRHVVADKVVLTAPFQQEEVEELAPGWVFSECVWWPPYGHERMRAVAGRAVEPGVIGFLSSGNWLRRELGKDQLDASWADGEETVLSWCQAFARERQGTRVRVFLHPVEKRDADRLARSIGYYTRLGVAAEDIISDRGGIAHPELMEVAVTVYSSAMFERLYAGYKGVFAQPGMAPGYFMNGPIRSIITHDGSTFRELISDALGQDEDAFFRSKGIGAYRAKGHPAEAVVGASR
jgi:hypothetical protein